MAGGWSLTITTEASSVATTTTVSFVATPRSTTGQSVTFTATVTASGNAGPPTGPCSSARRHHDLGTPVHVNASGVATSEHVER